MNEQWEYETFSLNIPHRFTGSKGKVDPKEITSKLNSRGNQGWELVSSESLEHSQGSSSLIFILKRRK